jgi:adenylate cyclase
MLFKRWQACLLIFLTVITLILPLRYFNFLEVLELTALDHLFRLRQSEPTDERIVIVGITEKDIQKYKTYPFNDQFLANLLDKIRAQKPIAIGLDLVRDVPVPPGTEELNEIFRTTPNLIGVGIIGALEDAYSHDIAFPPILKAKGQVGDVSGTIDVDRVVRRGVMYSLQDDSEESKIPALSLKMAYEYLKLQKIEPTGSSEGWLQLKNTVFYPYKHEEEGYQIIINWRNNFPLMVSVADVIEGKLPKNFFQNKLVFVGGTSLSLKDIFETPFGQRYGVEIQATMTSVVISSVLDGRGLIRGMESPYDYIYLVFWVIVASIAVRWRKIYLVFLVAFGATIISALVAYIAFIAYHWWLPWAYPVEAIVIGTIASITYIYLQDLKNAKTFLESQVQARTLELSESNRKLAATLEELKQTQQELVSKEKLASLGMLTAGLAHEIRNPLFNLNIEIILAERSRMAIKNILNEYELFLDDEENFQGLIPISSSNLQLIEEKNNQAFSLIGKANQIIDTILGYARRKIPERTSIDINVIITEAISAVSSIKQPELEVETILNFNHEIGESLFIRDELLRALINLIENAWNALIDKNEIVENFEPRIEIITEKEEETIVIRIADNGLGIAEEGKNNIFNPFFSTRKKKQGTGLGLYFVWEIIVNEHGGTISVESIEGEGAEFVVTIPIR